MIAMFGIPMIAITAMPGNIIPRRASSCLPPLQRGRAVLEGLRKVGDADVVRARKVGDGARDLQDAMEASGRQVHLLHRRLEKALRRVVEPAVVPDLDGAHVGVAHRVGALKTPELSFA